jgi:hypothetical protein
MMWYPHHLERGCGLKQCSLIFLTFTEFYLCYRQWKGMAWGTVHTKVVGLEFKTRDMMVLLFATGFTAVKFAL